MNNSRLESNERSGRPTQIHGGDMTQLQKRFETMNQRPEALGIDGRVRNSVTDPSHGYNSRQHLEKSPSMEDIKRVGMRKY